MNKKPSYDLRLISRYLCQSEGWKPKKIYEYLVSIMEVHYPGFNITAWQNLLFDYTLNSKKKKLVDIPYIPVTQNELLLIDKLTARPMKRVVFTMLCLAKYNNYTKEQNNDWINFQYKDIFKMSNVAATIKEQCSMIHEMRTLGLIHMNRIVDNLSLQICYIDRETQQEEVLQIKDFRNLGYEYLLYCGDHLFRCKRCGILVKRSGVKDTTGCYCKECKSISKKEQNQKYYYYYNSGKADLIQIQ